MENRSSALLNMLTIIFYAHLFDMYNSSNLKTMHCEWIKPVQSMKETIQLLLNVEASLGSARKNVTLTEQIDYARWFMEIFHQCFQKIIVLKPTGISEFCHIGKGENTPSASDVGACQIPKEWLAVLGLALMF